MKNFLMVIGGIVVGLIVLGFIIFSYVTLTSNKLVCKSDEGSVTLYYNDKKIAGYKAIGVSYDMNSQNKIVEQIGIKQYIEEFSTWFDTNTTGSCQNKKQ